MSSLYRIVEDSEQRLVLRGRQAGPWLLAAFLLLNGIVVLWVAIYAAGRLPLFPLIAGGGLGVFFTVCGLGALRWAITYRAAIEVEGAAGVVRFRSGRPPTTIEVPFADVASVEVQRERRTGPHGRRQTEYRVFLILRNGDERLIDRSLDGTAMGKLAEKVRALSVEAPAESKPAPARHPSARQRERAKPDAPPRGLSIEPEGAATLYRWRLLPHSLFQAFFWGFLTLFVGSLAVLSLTGMVIEASRRPPGALILFLILAALTIGLMALVGRRIERQGRVWLGGAIAAVILANLLIGVEPFIFLGAVGATLGYVAALCGFVLLGRCRLRVGPDGLEYEERVLGVPLGWRRRAVARENVAGFRIKDAVRGGGAVEVLIRGGGAFNLMIPQGSGAFSRSELERLRRRWQRELGPSVRGGRV